MRLAPIQAMKIQTMRTTQRSASSFFLRVTKIWFFPLYLSTFVTSRCRITMMSKSILYEEKVMPVAFFGLSEVYTYELTDIG